MRAIAALLRASFLAATSYRLGFVFSLGSLLFSFLPIYYVTRAMQPLMATAIAGQGDDYFSFFVVGMMVLTIAPSALLVLPGTLGTGIANGSLESLLGTPASLPSILAGLASYDLLWAFTRAILLLVVGVALGVRISLSAFLPGVVVLLVVVVSYLAMSAMLGAMVVAYRTAGPLPSGILGATTLLGGAYFPTQVIPTWVARISDFIPLTYGLRALRRLWLEGATVGDVSNDLLMLGVLTTALTMMGIAALHRALTTARQRGTLAQY